MLAAPGLAPAQTYPPVGTPGPALSVPQATLDAALDCSIEDLSTAARPPVLLIPGTSLTPEKNYDWNWIPAFDDVLNWEWCTVELPGSSMADVQIAGEYVVNAIRTMSAEYNDPIDVLGFSQGGMLPRWALRFWPDTRAMVDDVVGLAPSNHGTTHSSTQFCPGFGCAPAIWQQIASAGFIAALNSHQETFPGIDYTAIYTKNDDVVQPNANDNGSSSLQPGDSAAITNVAVQDVCTDPNAPYTAHLYIGTVNNAAYKLAVDALNNAGPASPTRPDFTGGACTSPMPGVDTTTGPTDFSQAQSYSNNQVTTYPKVNSEPFVACYAVTPCGPPTTPPGGGDGGGGSTNPGPTGRRAAALKKCKKKKGKARANCLKKAKKLPA